MIWAEILRWLLAGQLLFSASSTFYVTLRREQLSSQSRKLGAICWGISYVGKSALIAVAIIYGPEKNHWVALYAVLAMGIFGIGDAGLLLLWSETRLSKGERSL